jgi:Leucine-rich repeat (LRR) protein
MRLKLENSVPLIIELVVIISQLLSVGSTKYVAPEDCEWKSNHGSSDNVQLTCKLRTVNGAFDSTNFSLIQTQHTVGLTILCDDILFESSLSNRSFEHLSQLRELNIEKCKLSELPLLTFSGLSQLRNLTLRTHNNDWGDISLKIPTGGLLTPVRLVERIDLSSNSITWLPESIFCNLVHLQFINLTANQFSEIVSVGFSSKNKDRVQLQCKLDSITHLDLSYNRVKVLTDRGFGLLSKLQVLSLNHNQISRAEETSLSGLSELTILDLSNNQLVALPPKFFQSVHTSLTELYLQNNSISVLPPGLFNGLGQMVLLDLSHNEITSHWIGPDTFADLIRLVNLDLSFNRLSRIDASTFRSEYSLEILQLHHNEIESIADNAFSSLYNLHTLVLSHNRLTRIDSLSLSGLHVLNMLALDTNKIDYIDNMAFKNISNLMELNVSMNKLEAVPHAINALQFLRSLDLSHNRIIEIDNASYRGVEQLYSLNLEANQIGNLSKGVFQDLPSLRILNLAKNKIQAIEQGTFDDVPDLHALRLDSNYIVDINGLFSNLRDLLMLNISVNKIAWFDYALIPIGLQWLDVHDNQIDNLGNYFELESVLKLRTLDASVNKISEIDSSSLPDGIEMILLNNNQIKKIASFTFMEKQNLTRTDLTNNRLSTLDINAFRLSKVPLRRPLPEFSVSGNPYLCDCSMEWLQRIGTLDESRQYPRMVDVEHIVCQLSFTKQKSSVPLTKADSSQFLCPYKSHCFALCHCCEFDACDCEMTCPENCTCYYDQSWNTNIVDCSGQYHIAVPQRIPMDVTELYLDGNDIPSLSSHAFIGRKNMKVLHLNQSNIHTINNRTFNGLKSLQILNLNHNRLTQLYGYEFERLVDLKELYLSYNRIATVANNSFLALKSLQILHIDHNYIIEFQVWNLNYNTRLIDARIAHNMWSCECLFVEQFIEWLPTRTDFIQDIQDVQCFYNETHALPLLVEFNMTACTNFSARKSMFAQKYHVQDFVPFVIIGCSVFVLLLFTVIVIFIYRREMSVWFYSRYGVRLEGRAKSRREEEKLFDAFVSYSKKDEAFVAQILAPELEYGNPPIRLCLHYRDLPVASGYLSDAIVEAMEASRRTILVISENFLKSEWCRYEFKSAHHEVLRTNRHKLILIFIGRIASKDLDPDIRLWLKTNTFLQWGEKMFWEKLRYALPDIPYTRKPAEQTRDLTVAVHI